VKDQTLQIAKTVLSELDSFEKQFKVKEFAMPASGMGARQIKETREAQRRLLREPFVAFVKVEELREGIDDDWHEKIYLICRTYTPLGITPITPLASFANYKAPVGRVAAHEVGEELEIPVPGGKRRSIKRVYIREKNIFTSDKSQGWDAINNYFSLGDERQFVKSLRELMLSIYAETQPSQDEVVTLATPEDGVLLIEKLQEMEAVFLECSLIEAQRRESRRRQVVEQIGLKDQPILDQVQDAFFRLPIDSQIILSGAPGTGKTTTLIKRLARYSVPENLSEEEKEELGSDRFELLFDPQANWVMFTPNDLLKIYLKEALNKEWLSATDDFVKIWGNERMELAREVLRFLKTGILCLISRYNPKQFLGKKAKTIT
jgi:flagellar biosynthesis GTPase FlhF